MTFETMNSTAGNSQLEDNLNNCVYKDVYADVFYLFTCAVTPVAFLGIILNIINLIVLRMQRSSLTSVFLLRILAGCDLFFLVVCLVYFFIRHMVVYFINKIELFARPDNQIGAEIYYATFPFYFSSLQTRNWLIVLLSVERFLNLVFPLWARGKCTKRNITKVAIFIACFSFACHFPRFWAQYLTEQINPCTGLKELRITYHHEWEHTYDQILYIVVLVLVPLFLLYILNIILIIALKRAMNRRSQMIEGMTGADKSDQGQTQATLMVISIVILFTICETPASLDRLAMLAGVQFADDNLFMNYVRKIGLLLIVIDSAFNFVAYCISNRTFRRNLFRFFGNIKDAGTNSSVRHISTIS